jgi:hypothetical protein
VRFLAASSTAKLFELCAELGLSEDALLSADADEQLIRRSPPAPGHDDHIGVAEYLRQHALRLDDVRDRVVADIVEAPYQLLVRISGQSPELAEVAIVTLQGVATRLGFKRVSKPQARYGNRSAISEAGFVCAFRRSDHVK